MKVVDIANEIYSELGRPKVISIPPIVFWLRANIGALNSRLNEDFYVDLSSLEIKMATEGAEEDIDIEAASILKKMYLIHYYDIKIRESLGAADTDSWIEIASDGTSVRRVNKIGQGQAYQTVKNSEAETLNKMITGYKTKRACPNQVTGDDTVEGSYGGGALDARSDQDTNFND